MEGSFGGLIPIWDWDPVLVYFFLFQIDFGNILLIRGLIERNWYLTRFWSYRIGDTLGLPVYGAFSTVVISDINHPNAFYNQIWWQWVVLGVGVVLSPLIQLRAYITRFYSKEVIFNPSEMYHTAIFAVMFYLVASSIFPLVHDHDPMWATVGAFVGLGVWIAGFVYDSTPWQDQSPERDRLAFWELLS